MPDIKFGLRRASHHVSRPTCLSLLILCVFANWVPLPTPEHSRSHELFVHRLDSNNRTKYPLLYDCSYMFLYFKIKTKWNSIYSKFNIRRKIYDRHKSNSLTNNIVFEAVHRIRYKYINIAGAINTSVSWAAGGLPALPHNPHSPLLIEWGAGIVSQNETINCATAIPPYMDNTFVYGLLTRLHGVLYWTDSRNLCSLALVSKI